MFEESGAECSEGQGGDQDDDDDCGGGDTHGGWSRGVSKNRSREAEGGVDIVRSRVVGSQHIVGGRSPMIRR